MQRITLLQTYLSNQMEDGSKLITPILSGTSHDFMIDYEVLILARQEQIEIMEDNYRYCSDDEVIEEVYNPIIQRQLERRRNEKNH